MLPSALREGFAVAVGIAAFGKDAVEQGGSSCHQLHCSSRVALAAVEQGGSSCSERLLAGFAVAGATAAFGMDAAGQGIYAICVLPGCVLGWCSSGHICHLCPPWLRAGLVQFRAYMPF